MVKHAEHCTVPCSPPPFSSDVGWKKFCVVFSNAWTEKFSQYEMTLALVVARFVKRRLFDVIRDSGNQAMEHLSKPAGHSRPDEEWVMRRTTGYLRRLCQYIVHIRLFRTQITLAPSHQTAKLGIGITHFARSSPNGSRCGRVRNEFLQFLFISS